MFLGFYVPRVLCSPGPMFPSLYETGEHRTLFFKKGSYVPRFSNPVHMLLPGDHRETIRFMLLPTPSQPVILGHSWLRRHNPNIDWSTCSIQEWRVGSLHSCLKMQSRRLPPLLLI